MHPILNNPYRIAGVLPNASLSELEKNKSKFSKYLKIGKFPKSDTDFDVLEEFERTEDSLQKSFSKIEHNTDKVFHSLFWFLNTSPPDQTALQYLKEYDKDKAEEIWEKVTVDKDVNSKNFSAFNNIGTLKLLSDYQYEIKEGIESKIKLIKSDYFKNFVHIVADQTYSIEPEKQIQKLIDELLLHLNEQYSTTEVLELFSECDDYTKTYLFKKFTEEPILNIESHLERCKKKRKIDKGSAYEFGLKLFTSTKDDLSILKSLLGTSDLKYKAVADQLANEIMQCGIDYFNESQEHDSSEDFLKKAQELNKIALSIAVGKLTSDRAKDSLATLEKMKDKVIAQAIALLQSVKDAYETNEAKIEKQVNELVMSLKPINKSAVDDITKNSIDWDKVNELIKGILTDENLEKIKASSNNELKSEFTKLAYWLKEYSQSNSLISRIIEKYKKIPPKLSFKIVSSEITNTNNNPLYTKHVRYIGLKLNIEVKERCSVSFYLKYIDPDGHLNRNSKISPIGYTIEDSEFLNPQTKNINLSGWGNDEKCTYDIGDHRIEVYVDEHLIHTKKFTVDIAPSERLEKEIASAEKQLSKINQTDYYESKIKSAKNEMNEIQKFKLFRGSSKKEIQIQAQQSKIDKLEKKSKKKKEKDIRKQKEKIYQLKRELTEAKY